jgi:hypothetical protein
MDWGNFDPFPFHLEPKRKIVTLEARDASTAAALGGK